MNKDIFYNYKLSMAFGNNLGQLYSKNMVLIQFYERDSILLIPHYNTTKYPFPPLNEEMNYIGPKIEDRGTRRRINAFMEAPVIFFEDNETAGQYFPLVFEYDNSDLDGRVFHVKKSYLIYCVDSETYKWLYQTLRKDFFSYPSGHRFNRGNSIHNKALQFIEEKLISLKDELPDKFRDKIFRREE